MNTARHNITHITTFYILRVYLTQLFFIAIFFIFTYNSFITQQCIFIVRIYFSFPKSCPLLRFIPTRTNSSMSHTQNIPHIILQYLSFTILMLNRECCCGQNRYMRIKRIEDIKRIKTLFLKLHKFRKSNEIKYRGIRYDNVWRTMAISVVYICFYKMNNNVQDYRPQLNYNKM